MNSTQCDKKTKALEIMSFAESLSGSQCWGLHSSSLALWCVLLITALLSKLVSVAVEILVLKALQPGVRDVISVHIVRPTDVTECSRWAKGLQGCDREYKSSRS